MSPSPASRPGSCSRSGRSGPRSIVAVAGALAIEWLRSRGRATGDLALALVLLRRDRARRRARQPRRRGDASTSSPTCSGRSSRSSPATCASSRSSGVVIVAAIAIFGRALFAIVLDEESARVAGLPVDAVERAALGAHRGHGRRRDARRRGAADRRAHGAAGGERAGSSPGRSAPPWCSPSCVGVVSVVRRPRRRPPVGPRPGRRDRADRGGHLRGGGARRRATACSDRRSLSTAERRPGPRRAPRGTSSPADQQTGRTDG